MEDFFAGDFFGEAFLDDDFEDFLPADFFDSVFRLALFLPEDFLADVFRPDDFLLLAFLVAIWVKTSPVSWSTDCTNFVAWS